MKRLTPILLILAVLLLGGCQSVPIHGQGTYTAPNGNKYVGEWKNSKPHGQGTLTYADGGKYIGEFRNGKRNGQGTLTAPNGDKYINDLPISRLRDALRELSRDQDKRQGKHILLAVGLRQASEITGKKYHPEKIFQFFAEVIGIVFHQLVYFREPGSSDLPPPNRSILNERIFGTLWARLPNLE